MLIDEYEYRPSLRIRRVVGTLAISVALIAFAAGCAAESATNTTSAAPTQAVTQPSPRATQATTPIVESSDPAQWTIGFDGVGPFHLGGSLASAKDGAAESYTLAGAESCPSPVMSIFQSPAHPSLYVAVNASGSDDIASIFVGGDVPDTLRAAGSPKTDKGVGIGANLEDVTNAYPSAVPNPNPRYGPEYVVADPANASNPQRERYILFGLASNVVTGISVKSNTKFPYEFCG